MLRKKGLALVASTGIAVTFVVALPAVVNAGGEPPGGDNDHKVVVCHVPPGNPGNAHTIVIDRSALPAHLRHGDTLGPCRRHCPEVIASYVTIHKYHGDKKRHHRRHKHRHMCPVPPHPTPTPTPTATPTPEPCQNGCSTPTPTPTPEPTATPTPEPTATPTPGPTVTPTPTPVVTPPIAGPPGPPGAAGPPGPPGSSPKECISKRIAKWRITVRKNVRVRIVSTTFEGVHAPIIKRGTTKGGRRFFIVRISLVGLKHGVYVGRVKYRFTRANLPGRLLDPADFGRPRTTVRRKVHYFRACYGNPKGGKGEGMNPYPVTLL